MAANYLLAVYRLLQAEWDIPSSQQFKIKALEKKYEVWEEKAGGGFHCHVVCVC